MRNSNSSLYSSLFTMSLAITKQNLCRTNSNTLELVPFVKKDTYQRNVEQLVTLLFLSEVKKLTLMLFYVNHRNMVHT